MKKIILLFGFIAINTFLCFSQVPSYVPTNGLVGWWPFSGNANDGSGNGNHGTAIGASLTTDRYGQPNRAYYFTHTDVITTNVTSISGTQPRTFSFWMKNQYSNKTINPIWYGGHATNAIQGAAFNIIFNRNEQSDQCNCWPTTYQGIVISADWIYVLRPTTVGDNQWHNWTVVLSNSGDNFTQVKFYRDAILISAAITFNYNNNGSTVVNTVNQKPLKFGVSMGTFPDRAPTEYLDDIGVWNRALTQNEITALYEGTYCAPPQTVRF